MGVQAPTSNVMNSLIGPRRKKTSQKMSKRKEKGQILLKCE
jgi:hypothetical protein